MSDLTIRQVIVSSPEKGPIVASKGYLALGNDDEVARRGVRDARKVS